jgi:uridine phosphorylase
MHFYESDHVLEKTISDAFVKQTNWASDKSTPYVVSFDETLGAKFKSDNIISGFTATNVGFYGPQSRVLRLPISDKSLNDKLANFTYNNQTITNLEMETAGIYGMAKLLGHKAVSLNAILANRATGEFSNDPSGLVEELITFTLDKIVS